MRIKKSRILALVFIISSIGLLIIKIEKKCINHWKGLARKNRGLFILMDQWVNIKQEGQNLENYFIKNNYKKIAVYGMSYVGLRLVKELKNSEIEIIYGIDNNADTIYSDVKLVTIDSFLTKVDAVVVTLVNGFDKVRDKLALKLNCPILSIEDILNEV